MIMHPERSGYPCEGIIQESQQGYPDIPTETVEELYRFIFHKCSVGGFLDAVLRNDLKGAIFSADEKNLKALKSIVQFIYNECPMVIWIREKD